MKKSKKIIELRGDAESANERADVARRILELSETVSAGITYIRERPASIGDYAVTMMLKNIGEGLISLNSAATSIAKPAGADPEDIHQLETGFDEITECVDMLIDAYVAGDVVEFARLADSLDPLFTVYCEDLTRCFRASVIN